MSNLIVNKQDDISTLSASEYNQFAEINNLISSAGITADANVLNQVAKSVANYSNASNFFTENGTVNNYTLIANNNFLAPTAYITGMVIRFITTNANTTTTPTVNLNGLGAKNILKADGNPVIAGDVSGYVELRYNGTNFLLSPLSSALNITATNKGLTYLNNPITIANNATDANNDIDFTAGNFEFSDKSNNAVLLAMTKRLDASWTAGTNQGGLDTGSKANNTWYHCYAIHNPTSGVSDAIFSVNATTPTLPSGYTKYKYLGSVLTNVSGNIDPFIQKGNYFEWKDAFLDQAGTLAGTIIHPISVPPVIVLANISMTGGSGSGETYVQVGIFGNNATPNSAIDFAAAFFVGQWDSPGSATKLVLSTNQTIKSKTVYTRGSNSSYVLSTFGYYNLSL